MAQQAAPSGSVVLPPVEIIATPLSSGSAIDRWKVLGTVETLSGPDIGRGHPSSAAEILGQRIPGASLNDLQGNPFTQDLRYRGFAASPLQGTPQGLAVYENGVRLNEAFGDTLNWDLVLPTAIRSIELFSNNPIFGLNALGGATDKLGVIGPTPIELTRLDDRSIYTWPQTTRNEVGTVALNGKFDDLSPAWKLQGNLYVRRFDQTHIDGNAGDFEACSPQSSFGGQLCLQDDAFGTPPGGKTAAFRDRFVILGPNGATIPALPNTPYGTLDRTTTGSTTVGASLQASNTEQLLGHRNNLILGASIDHSDIAFRSGTALGFVYPDLFVGANPAVPGTGTGPIRTFGSLGFAPVDLSAADNYLGLYATDTFDITDRLSFSFGGQLNLARSAPHDASGTSPEPNGSHSYTRFNPFAGPAFKIAPDLSIYAGYSESNRAPTPLELSCSDRTHPCLLANALVADPPLRQVVSHSYETGLRGEYAMAPEGKLSRKLGLFRTDSDD